MHPLYLCSAISEFLSAFKVPLPATEPDYRSVWKDVFTVKAVRSVLNVVKSTRSLEIEMKHPGLIWPALAFDVALASLSSIAR